MKSVRSDQERTMALLWCHEARLLQLRFNTGNSLQDQTSCMRSVALKAKLFPRTPYLVERGERCFVRANKNSLKINKLQPGF